MTGISNRMLPMGNYEYVDVTFGPADTDMAIPFTRLRTDDPQSVRWMDVSPGRIDGVVAQIYRERGSRATLFGLTYVVLRSTVANYTTRLLLFVERNEASSE